VDYVRQLLHRNHLPLACLSGAAGTKLATVGNVAQAQ